MLGADWREGDISWNNAPANHRSSAHLIRTGHGRENGGEAQLLMKVTLPGDAEVGHVLRFRSKELSDFLEHAAPRPATLILTRQGGQSGSNSSFASKEHPDADKRPRLRVLLVSDPPNVTLEP